MRNDQRAWRTARAAMGQRFFLGAIVAASFTLVAFEWRMTPLDAVPPSDPLPIEAGWLDLPIIVRFEVPEPNAPAPKKAKTRPAVDPTVAPKPTTDPAPEPGNDPGTDNGPVVEPHAGANVTDLPVTSTFVPSAAVKPYFQQCLTDDPALVDPCTEERIQAHLQRNFQMPRSVRGQVRTTITFRVETDGSIGRIVCVPKVDAEVEREVARTLRSMPKFVPGSQGGVPVPVHYQIPLSLRMAG